jgi:hypothetical protein
MLQELKLACALFDVVDRYKRKYIKDDGWNSSDYTTSEEEEEDEKKNEKDMKYISKKKVYSSENKIRFIISRWNNYVAKSKNRLDVKYIYVPVKYNMEGLVAFIRWLMCFSYNIVEGKYKSTSHFHDQLMELFECVDVPQSLIKEYRDNIEEKLWSHKSSTRGPCGCTQPSDYVLFSLLSSSLSILAFYFFCV